MEESQKMSDAAALRRKAEMLLLQKSEIADHDSMQGHEVQKLLHELQVHQIELQMQNSELQIAYEKMEGALKRFTLLYDFAPIAHLTLDSNATILELNYSAAEMLGERRIGLKGSNFRILVCEESKPVFNNFYKNVFSSNQRESCKIELCIDDATLLHAHIEGVVISEENQCLISMLDLAHFRK
jgi:PAS domain S-box-containing protein